jgi:hypothetical protein
MSISVDVGEGIQRDIISHEPIHEMAFPICKTNGIDGQRGGFFDLNKVMKWVRDNGTDPMLTGQPMDWNNYRAVRWTNAQNIRVNINRQYNYRATEWVLHLLRRGAIGQALPPPIEEQYIQFRILMAESANANFFDQIDWLRDYWICHPYDPLYDAEIIGLRVPPPQHEYRVTRVRWTAFRHRMLLKLQNNPRDHLVAQYWKFHP